MAVLNVIGYFLILTGILSVSRKSFAVLHSTLRTLTLGSWFILVAVSVENSSHYGSRLLQLLNGLLTMAVEYERLIGEGVCLTGVFVILYKISDNVLEIQFQREPVVIAMLPVQVKKIFNIALPAIDEAYLQNLLGVVDVICTILQGP